MSSVNMSYVNMSSVTMSTSLYLSANEAQAVYQRFSALSIDLAAEHSYDTIWHKNVHNLKAHNANVFCLQVQPSIKRVFAWFTFWHDQNVCFMISSATHVEVVPACFNNELAWGTVLHGASLPSASLPSASLPNNLFVCENILFYKGVNVSHETYGQKMMHYEDMFTRQLKQTKYFIKFVLPVLLPTFQDACKTTACKTTSSLPYPCEHVQLYEWDQAHSLGRVSLAPEQEKRYVEPLKSTSNTANAMLGTKPMLGKPTLAKPSAEPPKLFAYFLIKPQLTADMYNLYCRNNIFYGCALIPNYKSSVQMNRLFRHIKENQNLDYLEESDEEAEFENISDDKFVNLNHSCVMRCEWSRRFHKWCPVEDGADKMVSTHAEVRILEQKLMHK